MPDARERSRCVTRAVGGCRLRPRPVVGPGTERDDCLNDTRHDYAEVVGELGKADFDVRTASPTRVSIAKPAS